MKRQLSEEEKRFLELQKKLTKVSEIIQASRQTLRMGFGFNPLSLRERILLRFQNQKNNQEKLQFQPILLRRMPLLERLQALRSQFQKEEPKSEEERIIEEYLREEKKKEILKKIKAQKEAEEREKRRRELERIKREMAVLM